MLSAMLMLLFAGCANRIPAVKTSVHLLPHLKRYQINPVLRPIQRPGRRTTVYWRAPD
jgi:hypothetical protein